MDEYKLAAYLGSIEAKLDQLYKAIDDTNSWLETINDEMPSLRDSEQACQNIQEILDELLGVHGDCR